MRINDSSLRSINIFNSFNPDADQSSSRAGVRAYSPASYQHGDTQNNAVSHKSHGHKHNNWLNDGSQAARNLNPFNQATQSSGAQSSGVAGGQGITNVKQTVDVDGWSGEQSVEQSIEVLSQHPQALADERLAEQRGQATHQAISRPEEVQHTALLSSVPALMNQQRLFADLFNQVLAGKQPNTQLMAQLRQYTPA
jgi:hypothetical protein